ncbi:MAG: sigma-70 family RNA polymerase sigma factor [Acidobacteria bacterium]|nr:sigma-70 family RNA polymerase sigma factor [Acidobacteriota bacterium]
MIRKTIKRVKNEDQEIIRRILDGEQWQYQYLVEKYQQRVINIVACITGDRTEAEDITQKVFIKIYYSLDRFDPSLPFFPWLYRVTVNQCYDELRRFRRKRQTIFSDMDGSETQIVAEPIRRPDHHLERKNLAGLVRKLLFSLPRRYRDILILKDVADHSYDEISEILGCSMQAVRLKVFRARNLLRKKISHLMKEERRFLSSYQ